MEFSVGDLPPAERLASFRTVTQTLYDAWPRGSPDAFDVVSTGYRVADLIFSQVQFSPLHFHRGPRHLEEKEPDFLVLEALLEGEQFVSMESGSFRMQPGRIYLRDWTHGFDAEAGAMKLHSVLIPRSRLEGCAWMHGGSPTIAWSLTDPSGRLMFGLWTALLAEFEHTSLADAEDAVNAFLAFIDALLGRAAREATPATLGAMQQFLRIRLRGDVGTEDLCAHFKVSRTTVYRLFEPHGGVRKYLTQLRMQRCYADLLRSDPQHRKVGDIASSWGFFEPSSFARAFKAYFGRPPSAVLGKGISRADPVRPIGSTWPAELAFGDYIRWYREATGSGWDTCDGPA